MEPNSIKPDARPQANKPLAQGTQRTLRRRQVTLTRALIVVLITAAALILFVVWYRTLPQRSNCYKQASHLAAALDDYRRTHHRFPPLLDILPRRAGRYNTEHYDYCFVGLGGPEDPPEGTLVAYCQKPHKPWFAAHWRHVLILSNHRVMVSRVPEDQFQDILARHLPLEPLP